MRSEAHWPHVRGVSLTAHPQASSPRSITLTQLPSSSTCLSIGVTVGILPTLRHSKSYRGLIFQKKTTPHKLIAMTGVPMGWTEVGLAVVFWNQWVIVPTRLTLPLSRLINCHRTTYIQTFCHFCQHHFWLVRRGEIQHWPKWANASNSWAIASLAWHHQFRRIERYLEKRYSSNWVVRLRLVPWERKHQWFVCGFCQKINWKLSITTRPERVIAR